MAQHSVLGWFKHRQNNDWVTFKEARDGLKDSGIEGTPQALNTQLRKLIKYGLLEQLETKGCSFRVKIRYPEPKEGE